MIDLKDKFADMRIDELLIHIITINVTGCKQVEANNAAVQIRQQLQKRINEIPTKHNSDSIAEVSHTNGWNRALWHVKEVLK